MMKKRLQWLAFMSILPLIVEAAPLMYVPTGGTNDLVIIDLDGDKIVGRIPELENSHGLAASPNGGYLVAGSMQQKDAGAAAKPAAVGEAEHAAHHAGAPAQATSLSYVSIVSPMQGRVVRRIAVRGFTHHTAVSPDGKYAVAVHSGAGGISVIDLDGMAVVKEMQTGHSPNYAVFSRNGGRLFVSNAASGMVSEIDTRDWRIKREIAVGKEPEHMVLAPDGATLYVANIGDGQVAAVNLDSGAVKARYSIGAQPHGLDISADGRWLFASSQGGGKLVRIDLNGGAATSADLKPAPYHLDYVDAVGKLYISSREQPKIWIVDPASLTVRGEIDIGSGIAHQMAVIEGGKLDGNGKAK
jgi:DNA-binding beta-propeller fold protein YncE